MKTSEDIVNIINLYFDKKDNTIILELEGGEQFKLCGEYEEECHNWFFQRFVKQDPRIEIKVEDEKSNYIFQAD